MTFTIERTGPACHDLSMQYSRGKDWEQWVYLGADAHIDNPHSRLDLKRRHLNEALRRGAPILEFGDTLDLMQGKADRRADKSSLREELRRTDYLNGVIEFADEFYKPYRENLVYLGKGNHETAITKHYEFDPLSALAYTMRSQGSPVQLGGYRGWVRFRFYRPDDNRKARGVYYVNLYQNHGSGGGGPVTRGVIRTNRDATYLPDADVVVGGHIHEAWHVEVPRVRLGQNGQERTQIQHHLRIPTYKEEFINEPDGYHSENGRPPKPLGAWWLRFYWSTDLDRINFQPIRTEQ
jgi:hypothetical protein